MLLLCNIRLGLFPNIPVSRRRSTLVSPMFREALGGEGGVERWGRRLTEYRRCSTLLMGPSLEEQEKLKELARKALEEQKLAKKNPADFDAQLFYNVYMESRYTSLKHTH